MDSKEARAWIWGGLWIGMAIGFSLSIFVTIGMLMSKSRCVGNAAAATLSTKVLDPQYVYQASGVETTGAVKRMPSPGFVMDWINMTCGASPTIFLTFRHP